VVIASFSFLVIAGIGAYLYFFQYLFPKQQEEAKTAQAVVVKKTADITSISPRLANNIGNFVTNVTKQEKGYILTINNYPAVFAYMTRNESDFILELASVISPKASSTKPITPKATTTEEIKVATSSQTQGATTTSSSTPGIKQKKATPVKTSTTTPVKATTAEELKTPIEVSNSPFKDITIDNQNMRVWTFEDRTVIYAFIADKAIAISSTPDGILTLRSAILR
jgi:hypothetical protein